MGIVDKMSIEAKALEPLESAWGRILDSWKESLGAFAYGTWIAGCSLLRETPDGTLVVGLASQFHCDYCRRMRERLLLAAGEVRPGLASIEFEVDSSLVPPQPRPECPEIPSVRIEPVVPDQRAPRGERPPFRDGFTFAEFVEGEANEMALNACRQVAENPGAEGLNPLIVYGGSGLGKTHLLHALGRQAWETRAVERVAIRTVDQLVAGLAETARRGLSVGQRFADYLRAGLVLVDDVQLLPKSGWVHDQFAELSRLLISRGVQLVVTSDKPLSELQWADPQRFRHMKEGMALEIGNPDSRLRLEILRQKLKTTCPDAGLSDEVLEFVSENDFGNVRELEGALLKLAFHGRMLGSECTIDIAQSILADSVRDSRQTLTLEMIAAETARCFGLTVEHLKSKSRRKEYVTARKVAMHLARTLLDQTLHSIGFYFNRDYSTVSSSIDTVEAAMALDPDFANRVERLRDRLVALRSLGE